MTVAFKNLWPVNPVRLAIVLNYTILLKEFMDQMENAIYIIEATLESAFSWIDDQVEPRESILSE